MCVEETLNSASYSYGTYELSCSALRREVQVADSNCAEGITRLSAVLPGRNRHASAVLASIDLRARTTVAMKGDKDVTTHTQRSGKNMPGSTTCQVPSKFSEH